MRNGDSIGPVSQRTPNGELGSVHAVSLMPKMSVNSHKKNGDAAAARRGDGAMTRCRPLSVTSGVRYLAKLASSGGRRKTRGTMTVFGIDGGHGSRCRGAMDAQRREPPVSSRVPRREMLLTPSIDVFTARRLWQRQARQGVLTICIR
jgi:hypothetical protein